MRNIETFEDLLSAVGRNGLYQKQFNVIFNLVLVFFVAMPYMNIIIALYVPDHWCKVPGREFFNLSIDNWKNLTIPRYVFCTVMYTKICYLVYWCILA